jgi:hypothetical protein
MKIKDATLIAIISTILLLIARLVGFIRYIDRLDTFGYIDFGIGILFPIGLIIFFIVLYNKQK